MASLCCPDLEITTGDWLSLTHTQTNICSSVVFFGLLAAELCVVHVMTSTMQTSHSWWTKACVTVQESPDLHAVYFTGLTMSLFSFSEETTTCVCSAEIVWSRRGGQVWSAIENQYRTKCVTERGCRILMSLHPLWVNGHISAAACTFLIWGCWPNYRKLFTVWSEICREK